ncbi:MAG TPA: DNA polymerase III subunit gamma and tau [Actinocrinis sp.]|uniref:DNA polymerase III subunit gamma and tau n=1 Tax=Actinocrinis sp. TaxID=1920516 RepID=UPI002DDD7206|nr:DNA polymerase III subunit gamma and tau [Actinocrinis sp.]HEV3172259.1 DNA polymerase III subunit gamma and tau [Actinocrinis sp.]
MSLALYRRYRPETFEEVIGQEHVTAPLQRALHNQRVNHAYLFSGPRGCGKTTSARILARCLNCEQGPTPTPCGVCKSCTDLSRGGPGSIDVIEIDAASHGGVDDARDLRERAFFAPVSARYKIYILDEAHMVSPAGFNALLKVVEEPPPHLKFIFATTEPEKVIGTIRSRTHHYPFRLVPPGVLRDYLAQVCEREQVRVDPDALPLVVRAGAGSVRDSMSVLDQLLAGAGDDGVTYQMAVSLLGFTDATLLDEAVSALAARDGAAAFRAVDHVVEGGHDPRRFLADLLERLRDLLILSAMPEAPDKGLISVPGDRLAAMREQAAAFGPAELSRAADLVNAGLLEMRGATSQRLLLELVCARVLLPAADDSTGGFAARLDRLERGGGAGVFGGASGPAPAMPRRAVDPGGPVVGLSPGDASPPAAMPSAPEPPQAPPRAQAAPPQNAPPQTAPPAEGSLAAPSWLRSSGSAQDQAPQTTNSPPQNTPAQTAGPDPAASAPAATPAPASPPSPRSSGAGRDSIRQLWPQVLDAVARRSKVAWVIFSQNVHVVGVEGNALQLGFSNSGLRDNFPGSPREDVLREALREVSGADWKIDAMVDPSAGTATGGGPPPAPPTFGAASATPGPSLAPQNPQPGGPGGSATVPGQALGSASISAASLNAVSVGSASLGAVAMGTASISGASVDGAVTGATTAGAGSPDSGALGGGAARWSSPPASEPSIEDDIPDPDDEDVHDAGPNARDLLIRELGATVLEESGGPD